MKLKVAVILSMFFVFYISATYGKTISADKVLKFHFKGNVVLDNSVKKAYLEEDLNGDGRKDLLVFVKAVGRAKNLKDYITLVFISDYYRSKKRELLMPKELDYPVALVIINSINTPDEYSDSKDVYLLLDVNIFGISNKKEENISVLPKNELIRIPNSSKCKGGAVKAFTESGDSQYLCWIDENYIWIESEEDNDMP